MLPCAMPFRRSTPTPVCDPGLTAHRCRGGPAGSLAASTPAASTALAALLALASLATPAAAREPAVIQEPAAPPESAAAQPPAGVQDPVATQAPFGADQDGDGVRDAADVCPGTARGLPVDYWGCPTQTDEGGSPGLVLVGGIALVLIAAVVVWIRRARAEARAEADLPPLVVPVTGRVPVEVERSFAGLFPNPPPGSPTGGAAGFAAAGAPVQAWSAPAPAGTPASPIPEAGKPYPLAPSAADGGEVEGTLQLLPGRFEVLAGPASLPDLRFVRGPGRVTELTIGRQAGRLPDHIQLLAPTVSRRHARMRFEDGRWAIANLSETNPLVVNGRALPVEEAPHPLSDGDRVEVGEFVLVFREK